MKFYGEDDQTRLIRYQHAPRDSFEEFTTWRIDAAINFAEAGDAILIFVAVNPDLLSGQDLKLITTQQKIHLKYGKPLSDLKSKNLVNWSVIAAPVDGWTEKVFPHLPSEEGKNNFGMLFSIYVG